MTRPVATLGADICLRCWARLSLTSTPLASSFLVQRRHTSTATPKRASRPRAPKKEKKESLKSDGEDAVPKRAPNPSAWTSSLLQTQTLGRTASVIVMRDSESNRIPQVERIRKEDQQAPMRFVSPDEILKIVDDNRNAPGQEEVNRHLDSLRPRNSLGQDKTTISSEEFQGLLEEIRTGFAQLQLSRYITIHQGDAMLRAQAEVARRRSKGEGISLLRSAWVPANSTSTRTYVLKGKKGLVNVIMRSIWGVEAHEEQEQMGAVNVGLDDKSKALLQAGGSSSALQQVRSTSGVQIDLHQGENILRITASRSGVDQVVEEIERLLNEMIKMTVDLSPLRATTGNRLSAKAISTAAESSGCVVETSHAGDTLLIHSRTEADANDCRASLVTAAGLPSRLISSLVHSGEGDAVGFVSRLTGTEGAGNLGRFITSHSLGGDDSPSTPFSVPGTVLTSDTRTRIQSALDASTTKGQQFSAEGSEISHHPLIDLSIEELGDPSEMNTENTSRWSDDVKTTYRADIGQVLHQAVVYGVSQVPTLETTADNLIREISNKKMSSSFQAENPSLPQFLLRSTPFAECFTADALRLRLIPSPWLYSGSVNVLKFPEVDLTLRLDRRTQTVKVEELRAVDDVHQVDVLLPKLATDVRLVKETAFTMENADDVPVIKSFLRQIEHSAAGYGKISAPPFLRLKIPAAAVRGRPSSPQDHCVEVEYFVGNMRFEQTLQIDYAGDDLLIKRNKASEKVSLRLREQPTTQASSDLPSETPSKEADLNQFLDSVSGLLKSLNEGLGKRMVPLELEDAGDDFSKPLVGYTIG